MSPKMNECVTSPHGLIGTWDVLRVTDMSRMFDHAKFFDSGVSKSQLSSGNDISGMFLAAKSFNRDLAK